MGGHDLGEETMKPRDESWCFWALHDDLKCVRLDQHKARPWGLYRYPGSPFTIIVDQDDLVVLIANTWTPGSVLFYIAVKEVE